MIKLAVRLNRDTTQIEIPADSKVSDIMYQINEKLSIPPESQQIIFKGAKINQTPDKTLSELQIKNGTKLLLLKTEKIAFSVEDSKPQPAIAHVNLLGFPTKPHVSPESLTNEPHQTIISKGLPPNCEKPYQSQMSILPKMPFAVYNTDGILSKLTFESDAIWVVAADGNNERIFFNEIRGSVLQEIPGYEKQYNILILGTKIGKRCFYFIPNQYAALIKRLIP